MRIVVFGASGRTGRLLVQQALEAGHEVTAFVRDLAKLALESPRLRVVKGELDDPAALEAAIRGQDAVLVTLGPVRGGRKDIMEAAARAILGAMRKLGVRRLVTLTGAGVAQPGDAPKAFNRLMSVLLSLFAREVVEDSKRHVELVRGSGLDWTVVRVPMLTDGPRTGQYRVGMVGINSGARIARADVADFMLKALTDSNLVGKSPVISY